MGGSMGRCAARAGHGPPPGWERFQSHERHWYHVSPQESHRKNQHASGWARLRFQGSHEHDRQGADFAQGPNYASASPLTLFIQGHRKSDVLFVTRQQRWWACLLEDITKSQWWTGVREELLKECVSHSEFVHITVDATVRILRRVVGQLATARRRQRKPARSSQKTKRRDDFCRSGGSQALCLL